VNARSWEIDGNGLWAQLDELLSYVANCPGVQYVTNSEASKLARPESAGSQQPSQPIL
jgi:hypothetical protein